MDGPLQATNLKLAIDYCKAHPQWKLSAMQTHKLLQIPKSWIFSTMLTITRKMEFDAVPHSRPCQPVPHLQPPLHPLLITLTGDVVQKDGESDNGMIMDFGDIKALPRPFGGPVGPCLHRLRKTPPLHFPGQHTQATRRSSLTACPRWKTWPGRLRHPQGTSTTTVWPPPVADQRSRCTDVTAGPDRRLMAARCVMVLGTTSGAGKSWLTTALCRWYARQGLKRGAVQGPEHEQQRPVVRRPQPGEIGSAQYFQAWQPGPGPRCA